MKLRPVLTTVREARAFIASYHRHLPESHGGSFALGLADDFGARVAVALVGRPLAFHLDDGETLEVLRVAVRPDTPNACSKLYGAARRIAAIKGAWRILTYTRADEPGTSLRASGWLAVERVAPRAWPSGAFVDVEKTRWEAILGPAPATQRAGERLAAVQLREEGLTVRDIAARLGCSKSHAGRLVAGVPVPTASGTVPIANGTRAEGPA